MTILNLMLGEGRGGLEQAALDYAESLKLAQLPALSILSPGAWIEAAMVSANVAHEPLPNGGWWKDFGAARHLRAIAAKHKARLVICHGNRALKLALKAFNDSDTKIAPVAHNYSTKRFKKADLCFAITEHLAQHLGAMGVRHVVRMPNMVRVPDATDRPDFRTPPVIGSLGRFVPKKGFLNFIEAMSVLRSRGVAFHAILGGDGEEKETILDHITRYQLQDHVTLSGWVANKRVFFESIDLFVLPSIHEPFGIALIEAMSHGVPVISTDSEGPREILHHERNGLLTKKRDPQALADAIERLLRNAPLAAALGRAGQSHVAAEYSMQAMARRLQSACKDYI